MPNNNVFRGSDATLVLAVDDSSTVEGQLADGLITEYELSSVVGRLQQVTVKVDNDVRPYHEIGKRFASELRPGNIYVSGTAARAHINGALIRLLLGEGATGPSDSLAQPTFNMVINILNPALPGNSSKVVLFGVKFDSWVFNLPEDDFIMESVSFKAIRIGSEETSG
ncbi:MAG: hypothetical protein Fur0044_38650 [Anaerolineae bacterium]|nr:hypothetical protein [Anaerolineales bacterium]MCQ3975398.1 hypothetical protein [Anaerolineae bacterium]